MTMTQVTYEPIIQYSSNALLQSTDQTGLILGTWNKKQRYQCWTSTWITKEYNFDTV